MIDNEIINDINTFIESKVNKKRLTSAILHLIVSILVTIISIDFNNYTIMFVNIPIIVFYIWSNKQQNTYLKYKGLNRLTYNRVSKNDNYFLYSISFECEPETYIHLSSKHFESLSLKEHSEARTILDNFILDYHRKNIRTDIKIN